MGQPAEVGRHHRVSAPEGGPVDGERALATPPGRAELAGLEEEPAQSAQVPGHRGVTGALQLLVDAQGPLQAGARLRRCAQVVEDAPEMVEQKCDLGRSGGGVALRDDDGVLERRPDGGEIAGRVDQATAAVVVGQLRECGGFDARSMPPAQTTAGTRRATAARRRVTGPTLNLSTVIHRKFMKQPSVELYERYNKRRSRESGGSRPGIKEKP